MATVAECHRAVDTLVDALHALDPELRSRHVPARTVVCRITDLDLTFRGRLDEDGVHDVTAGPTASDADPADVRVSMDSDQLLALADREDDFLHAWLRGRVQISASVRDLLRLRSLLGL